METVTVTVINILWEKISFDFSDIQKMNKTEDYGLYQVYGHHSAYGDDVLLYIGKTEQLFANRLNKRWEFIESCVRPTYIRFGRITKSSKTDEPLGWEQNLWGHMITIAEKVLIKAHLPAMNKKENSDLFPSTGIDNQHYLILNWEEYGQLLPEISTLRTSYKYWNFENPLSTKDVYSMQ